MLRGEGATHPVPVEYAIALRFPGGPFSTVDMDALLSKVREQWKNFKPLSKEHSEYVAQLNAFIQGADPKVNAAPLTSIKPILISIERLSPEAYLVLSVRRYVSAGSAGTVISTKIVGTAMVLQGARLMQLEILRELRDPSDVDSVRQQIVRWTHDIVAGTGTKTRSQ